MAGQQDHKRSRLNEQTHRPVKPDYERDVPGNVLKQGVPSRTAMPLPHPVNGKRKHGDEQPQGPEANQHKADAGDSGCIVIDSSDEESISVHGMAKQPILPWRGAQAGPSWVDKGAPLPSAGQGNKPGAYALPAAGQATAGAAPGVAAKAPVSMTAREEQADEDGTSPDFGFYVQRVRPAVRECKHSLPASTAGGVQAFSRPLCVEQGHEHSAGGGAAPTSAGQHHQACSPAATASLHEHGDGTSGTDEAEEMVTDVHHSPPSGLQSAGAGGSQVEGQEEVEREEGSGCEAFDSATGVDAPPGQQGHEPSGQAAVAPQGLQHLLTALQGGAAGPSRPAGQVSLEPAVHPSNHVISMQPNTGLQKAEAEAEAAGGAQNVPKKASPSMPRGKARELAELERQQKRWGLMPTGPRKLQTSPQPQAPCPQRSEHLTKPSRPQRATEDAAQAQLRQAKKPHVAGKAPHAAAVKQAAAPRPAAPPKPAPGPPPAPAEPASEPIPLPASDPRALELLQSACLGDQPPLVVLGQRMSPIAATWFQARRAQCIKELSRQHGAGKITPAECHRQLVAHICVSLDMDKPPQDHLTLPRKEEMLREYEKRVRGIKVKVADMLIRQVAAHLRKSEWDVTSVEVLMNLPEQLQDDARLEEYVVGDDDPRVGLRGEKGVRARTELSAGTLLGLYGGYHMLLMEFEDFLKSPPSQILARLLDSCVADEGQHEMEIPGPLRNGLAALTYAYPDMAKSLLQQLLRTCTALFLIPAAASKSAGSQASKQTANLHGAREHVAAGSQDSGSLKLVARAPIAQVQEVLFAALSQELRRAAPWRVKPMQVPEGFEFNPLVLSDWLAYDQAEWAHTCEGYGADIDTADHHDPSGMRLDSSLLTAAPSEEARNMLQQGRGGSSSLTITGHPLQRTLLAYMNDPAQTLPTGNVAANSAYEQQSSACNAKETVIQVAGWPFLFFVAKQNIRKGEALAYRYGNQYWKHVFIKRATLDMSHKLLTYAAQLASRSAEDVQ